MRERRKWVAGPHGEVGDDVIRDGRNHEADHWFMGCARLERKQAAIATDALGLPQRSPKTIGAARQPTRSASNR